MASKHGIFEEFEKKLFQRWENGELFLTRRRVYLREKHRIVGNPMLFKVRTPVPFPIFRENARVVKEACRASA